METMASSYSAGELSEEQLDQVAGGYYISLIGAWFYDRLTGWNCDDGKEGTTWQERICRTL